MKRNWDIIERILSQLESDIHINDIINNDEIINETYHLLKDDKYILSDSNSDFPTARLTMKGHDLLEYLRCFRKNGAIPKTEDTMKTYFLINYYDKDR